MSAFKMKLKKFTQMFRNFQNKIYYFKFITNFKLIAQFLNTF